MIKIGHGRLEEAPSRLVHCTTYIHYKRLVQIIRLQAITRSRAANSKKEVDTKANQRPTTKTSECVFHRKYF